jgi:hypothetical protein
MQQVFGQHHRFALTIIILLSHSPTKHFPMNDERTLMFAALMREMSVSADSPMVSV